MSTILLPIKPIYVNKIFDGVKQFEYRRVGCKQLPDKIIIYATAPIKKVVGEVDVFETLRYSPDMIWDITNDYAGVSKEEFDSYFKGIDIATAYQIGNGKKYITPKSLSNYGIDYAPQSFVYLKEVQGE